MGRIVNNVSRKSLICFTIISLTLSHRRLPTVQPSRLGRYCIKHLQHSLDRRWKQKERGRNFVCVTYSVLPLYMF
jgi:hypothetical protein